MTALRVRPFSNGSEYRDWTERNCRDGCLFFDAEPPKCELEFALGLAYFGDGTIAPEIARRLGCSTETMGYPAAHCPKKLT